MGRTLEMERGSEKLDETEERGYFYKSEKVGSKYLSVNSAKRSV